MDRLTGRSLAARLFGGAPSRTLALLQAAWPRVVGGELARRTEVVAVERGTLRVRVPDAGWRKVLHRMQPQILGRLREVVGELAPGRLAFVEGAVMAPAPEAPPTPAPAGPLDPAVAGAAEAIGDEEVRTRFVQAARRYLSRSKG